MAVQGTPPGSKVFGTGQATAITSNTTFVVPANVTKVKIHTYAPGGGAAFMGGSGAGGGYASCTVNVTPGSCCCIIVGAGGAAGNASSFNGANGGFTCAFGACATGGGGGRSYLCCTSQATVNAASGGTGTGTVSYTGGSGSCCVWGGAGGAATRLGPGGAGGNAIQGGGGGVAAGAGCIGGGSAFGPGTTTVGAPDSYGTTTCGNARAYGGCDNPQSRYPGEVVAGGGGGCLGGIGGIGGGSGGRGGCTTFACGVPGNLFGGASGGIRCGASGGIGAGGTSAGFCLSVSCLYGGPGSPYTYCSSAPLTHCAFTPALACARDSCYSNVYTAERARYWWPLAYPCAACITTGCNCGSAAANYCLAGCGASSGVAAHCGQATPPCCGWSYRHWMWSENTYYTGMQWEKSHRASQCCYNCTLTRNDGYLYRLYLDRCYLRLDCAHEDCCGSASFVCRCGCQLGYGWRLAAAIIPTCFTLCDTGISSFSPTIANECSRTTCELTGSCTGYQNSHDVNMNCGGGIGAHPPGFFYNVSSCDCTLTVWRRSCCWFPVIEQIALCNGNVCVCRSINPYGCRTAMFDCATGDTLMCVGQTMLVAFRDPWTTFSGFSGCLSNYIICSNDCYSVACNYCAVPNIGQDSCCGGVLGLGSFAQCRFYSKNCSSSCLGKVVITEVNYHCDNTVIGQSYWFSNAYIYNCDNTTCAAAKYIKPMGALSTGSVLWHYNKMLCDMPASCPDIWTMLLNRHAPTERCQTWMLTSASAGITTDPTCNCYKGMTQWACGLIGSSGCIAYVTTPDPLSVRYLPTSNTFIAFEGGNCHGSAWYGWSCTLEGDWTWCCMCGTGMPCLTQWTCCSSLSQWCGDDKWVSRYRTGRVTFPPSNRTATTGSLNLASGDRVVMIASPCCEMCCATTKCFYRCCLYVTNNIQCFACWCKYTFPCCGTGEVVYIKQFDRFYISHLGGYFSYSNRSADGVPVFCSCCISTSSIPFCDQQGNSCSNFCFIFHWNRLCCKQLGSCLGPNECHPIKWNAIRHYQSFNDCCDWGYDGVCHESPAMYIRTAGTCFGFGITTDGSTFGWRSLVPQDPNVFHVVGGANSTILISPTPGCNHAYFYNGNTTVTDITSTCFATTCGCRMIMHHNGNFFMWDRYCIKNSVHLTANNTTGTLSANTTWIRTPSSITTLTTGVCEYGPTAILCTQNCSGQTCFLMVRQPTDVMPYCPADASCTKCCVQLARSSDLCNWTLSCTMLCHTGCLDWLAFDVEQMVAHYDPCYDLTFLGAPGQFIAVNNNLTSACQIRCTMYDPIVYPNAGSFGNAIPIYQCASCIATVCCNCFNCWMYSMVANHYCKGLSEQACYRCRGVYAVCPQMTGNGGAIIAWPYTHNKYFVPDCDFTNAAAPRYIFNKLIGPSVVATYCTCTCVFTLEAKPQNWSCIVSGTFACCAHYDYAGSGGNGMAVIEY